MQKWSSFSFLISSHLCVIVPEMVSARSFCAQYVFSGSMSHCPYGGWGSPVPKVTESLRLRVVIVVLWSSQIMCLPCELWFWFWILVCLWYVLSFLQAWVLYVKSLTVLKHMPMVSLDKRVKLSKHCTFLSLGQWSCGQACRPWASQDMPNLGLNFTDFGCFRPSFN